MTLANLTGSWAPVVWEISVVLSQVFFFFFCESEGLSHEMRSRKSPWVMLGQCFVFPEWAKVSFCHKFFHGLFSLTPGKTENSLRFCLPVPTGGKNYSSEVLFFFFNKSNFLGIWRLGFEVVSVLCKWFLSYLMRELLWLRFLGNIRNSDTSSPHQQM